MDIAIQRPLLVTCSHVDAVVRIWNYNTLKCEIAKQLITDQKESHSNNLLCVAMHPTGYYIAVGFEEKIRMFHILYDDLRFFRDINIKNASSLKFSHGGNFLATASHKAVIVYDTYSMVLIANYNAHTSQVNDIAWSKNDTKLVSVGSDGGIYEYQIFKKTKDAINLTRSTDYTSVVYLDRDVPIACGMD